MTKAPIHFKLKPTNDIVFKAMFIHERDKEHELLKSFLHALYNITVKEIVIKDREITRESAHARDIRLDISALINRDIVINLEMQMRSFFKDVGNRSMYYASRIYVSHGDMGESYEDDPSIRQVFLLNYNLYPWEEGNNEFMMRDASGHILTEKMKINIIEMNKISNKIANYEEMDNLEKWCYFFLNGHKQEDILINKLQEEAVFKKAMEVLKIMNEDEKLRDIAFAREIRIKDEAQLKYEGRQEGFEQGLKQGIEQGLHNGTLSVAKNMILMGMKVELIQQATGLSTGEILQLKNQFTN